MRAIIRDDQLWRRVYCTLAGALAGTAPRRPIPYAASVIPWYDRVRDLAQFHATWATFRAPPPHPDPRVTFVDAPFTTYAVHFHPLGPHLRLTAHKWVVHDLDPDAKSGIVAVLSHYVDQDAVTLVGVFAVHVLNYPSWSLVATHCLSSFGDDAAPDGAFADSESRLLKLLAVNRKDQTYALVDWVADAPSRLLIISYATQEHEPRIVGQFQFGSASQNTPELVTRANGNYLLMYLDPVHDHSVVLQHLSRTLRPLNRHQLRPNTCHFHYDAQFPQYVLTSHTDGRTVLWDAETATAVASIRVSRQHPVELSIFRPWWAPPPPAPPEPGAAPFLPPILSVLITTDDWDLHSPHSMYLYTPAPLDGAITDDDDDDDGARALDEPESVMAKQHLLYHWDAPAFLACMASHHLFFSLDPFGHVRVHDMARDVATSTITSLNLRVHDRFARVAPDHVFRTRTAFLGLQRNGTLQHMPDRSFQSMVTKFMFPRTAICSELARLSEVHAATDADEPPAAPESAPSTTATAMSMEVPTFTIQAGEAEPVVGEAAPHATAAAGGGDEDDAAGTDDDGAPVPPPPMGDGADESDFDPEDEFDPDVFRMLPYGDLMFLGRDAMTMLVYRGPLLIVLQRHRGGDY
ncbi:hypothetical protein GGF31_001325 [Allomyces arbusculus]|nr:hypothetical protein GGF31_001325 [Allomyces arbusculus]